MEWIPIKKKCLIGTLGNLKKVITINKVVLDEFLVFLHFWKVLFCVLPFFYARVNFTDDTSFQIVYVAVEPVWKCLFVSTPPSLSLSLKYLKIVTQYCWSGCEALNWRDWLLNRIWILLSYSWTLLLNSWTLAHMQIAQLFNLKLVYQCSIYFLLAQLNPRLI